MNCDKCDVVLTGGDGVTSVAFVVSSYMATGAAAEHVRICRGCVGPASAVMLGLSRPGGQSNFVFASMLAPPASP